MFCPVIINPGRKKYLKWIINQEIIMAITEARLLSVKQLAVYLDMPEATIYSKKCRGEFPAKCIVKLDGKLRFDRVEIDRWIDTHKG